MFKFNPFHYLVSVAVCIAVWGLIAISVSRVIGGYIFFGGMFCMHLMRLRDINYNPIAGVVVSMLISVFTILNVFKIIDINYIFYYVSIVLYILLTVFLAFFYSNFKGFGPEPTKDVTSIFN